jgi:hypothetical protein
VVPAVTLKGGHYGPLEKKKKKENPYEGNWQIPPTPQLDRSPTVDKPREMAAPLVQARPRGPISPNIVKALKKAMPVLSSPDVTAQKRQFAALHERLRIDRDEEELLRNMGAFDE